MAARPSVRLTAVAGRKLVGRDAELDAIARLLGSGRLLSLLGPGGIGKTRLALAAIERARSGTGAFGEVLFAALGPERTVEAMCRAIGGPLEVPMTGTEPVDAVASSIGSALRARGRTLLVLDEIEHLLPDAIDCIEVWLEEAPELVVLATSRHALAVPAERSIELLPLRVPRAGEHDPEASAIAMFVDCVRSFRRDYAPGEAELRLIAEIVRRLEGLPLAIELAAARLRLLSPAQLLERLDEALRSGPGRALGEAIERSWGLLDPVEQRALAQCSVFRRGFTPEAAEAVLRTGEPDVPVLDVLQSLREKSLLAVAPGEPVRLSLLESLREFAGERLDALGIAAETRDRHADYYARAVLGGEDRENLVAALSHRTGHADALPLVLSLAGIGSDHPTREEIALIERAVDAAGDAEPRLLAAALQVRARAVHWVRLAEAEPLCRDVIERAERLGDVALAARATADLALVLYRQFRMPEAREASEAAAVLAREAKDRALEVRAQNRLAATLGSMGEKERALALAEMSSELARRIADPALISEAVTAQGTILLENGDHDGARHCFEEAVRDMDRAGMRQRRFVKSGYLALTELGAGRLDEAARHADDAVARARYVGHPKAVAIFLAIRGAIDAGRGDLDAAQARLAEGLTVIEHDPVWRTVSDLHSGHLDLAEARAAADRGDVVRARARFFTANRRVAEARARRMAEESTPARPPPLLCEVSDDLRIAMALLERRIEACRTEMPALAGALSAEPGADDRPLLTVGHGALWFAVDGGERIDLAGRAVLRHVLWSLCERHLQAPGKACTTPELVASAWPGERMRPRSGAGRLYVTLAELRKLGLRDVITSAEGGYLLRCELRVLF